MFNRKLKVVIGDLQSHSRSRGHEIYNMQLLAESMQSTAFRQEAAIRALKKEAAIHTEQLKYYSELANTLDSLLKIIKTSGIIEEAVKGEDLFQFRSTVDILRRNPLYKINKVVTIKGEVK